MTTTEQRMDQRFELVERILDNAEAGDILWERYFPNGYSAEWNGQKLTYEVVRDARPRLHISSDDEALVRPSATTNRMRSTALWDDLIAK